MTINWDDHVSWWINPHIQYECIVLYLYGIFLKNLVYFLTLSTKSAICGLKHVKKKFTIKLGMTEVEIEE